MVLPLILLLWLPPSFATIFKVGTFKNKSVTIKLPDRGVKKIMKTQENPAVYIINVASIKLPTFNKDFIVQYTSGGSDDPTLKLKWIDGKKEKEFETEGTSFEMLSSGEIFASGHTNNKYSQRKKFIFKNGNFIEVQQPFYFAGIKTIVLKNVEAKIDFDQKSATVFQLNKNDPVEVVLSDVYENYFLIKNKDGLLGWIEIETNQRPTVLRDIFFLGD